MRPDPRVSFLLGLVALAGAVAIGVLFAFDPTLFSRRVTWVARLEDASTLDDGAPVFVHGALAGRVVSRVWAADRGGFRVDLRMDPDWTPPRDGGVRVAEVNPLRGAFVEVVDASECQDRQPALDTAGSARSVAACRSQPGLFAVATNLLQRTTTVVDEAQQLLGKFGVFGSQAAGSPSASVEDGGARSQIAGITQSVAGLTDSAKSLMDAFAGLQPPIRQALVSADGVTRQANATLQRLDRTLDGVNQLIRTNSGSLQGSLADIHFITGSSSASIVRLVSQLDTLTTNLSELTRQLRDNPAILLYGRSLDHGSGGNAPKR